MSSYGDLVKDALSGVTTKNGAGYYKINCPLCPMVLAKGTEDRDVSMGVHAETGGFKCFRCLKTGYIDSAHLSRATNVAPEEKRKVRLESDDFVPLWSKEGTESYSLRPAYSFLFDRGFSMADIHRAFMHGCSCGYYAGRVIVPHTHDTGEVWGFSSRLWTRNPPEGVPKTLYPPGMDRDILYNEQALYIETDVPCMVVEGAMDSTWYLPHAVACLGKPTSAHFDKFLLARRPLVFCLDGDAWRTAKALHFKMRMRKRPSGWLKLPAKQDPQSVDPVELWGQVTKAKIV